MATPEPPGAMRHPVSIPLVVAGQRGVVTGEVVGAASAALGNGAGIDADGARASPRLRTPTDPNT